MLESLKYVVTFNTTGRTLKNEISFKPGLTVIKGENEAGKSFVLEMIRYALFGADALRGTMSDYDKLEVTLNITIKGKKYTIERKGKKATVNKTAAIGTTATNNYIKSLLGFGLSVFDISGHAMQGELDKLTKDLGPTERRRIIDEVTGLNQYEAAEKECRQQANEFRKVAEALEAQLVEPVEPAKPSDYEPSDVLKTKLDEEIRNQTLRDSFEEMEEPVEPVQPQGSEDSIAHEEQRKNWYAQRDSIGNKLARLPEIDQTYRQEQLNLFLERISQDERGPRSSYKEEDLLQWREDHAIRNREEEPLYCGECGAVVSGRELPEEPVLSLGDIAEELRKQKRWEGHTYRDDLPESPLSRQEITDRLSAFDAAPERVVLQKQLQDLGKDPEDRSEEAAEWKKYLVDVANYERDLHGYRNYLMKKQVVDSLPEPQPLLRERYEMALRYETLLGKYETTKDIYETQMEKLEKVKAAHEGYKRGSAALKDARKEVKRYLVPSLSKVASQLLVEMTDGQRRHIFIDENFDIWVDNQPVRTLSGSGVSVVNLALRVALGRVLTQSVIPIFLADEIDANMADKRTEATHASLRRLTAQLKQIIVVTHKEFKESDQTVWIT
jgi:exonuclease SbcC